MAQANTHTEVAPKLLATIRHSLQEVIGTKLELSLRTSLRIDLPLDALQELRVVEALEHDLQRTLDHALFLQCDTISDVVVWLHSRVAQFDMAAVLKKLTPTSSRAQRAAQALLRKATGARGTATRSGIEALSTPRSLVFVADDRAALAQLSRIEKALGPRAGQLSVVVPDTVCPRTSGLNPASSATYVGLRQLLGLTRALLHHGRIPVVLATTAAYDGCRTGLGRLLFETDVDLIPVAVPVGVSSKPERLLLGHSIDGQELRKLLLEREVGDLERAAGAMLSRIFDELRQGRRPLVAELLITRQEADEPLRGTARRPTLERADQVPGLFQDSWSP